MFTILMRVRMAAQLAWCALAHGMTRYAGTYRCMKCCPIRKRKSPDDLAPLYSDYPGGEAYRPIGPGDEIR